MSSKTKMPDLSYIGPQRYICTVIEEIRVCIKKLNFSPISSLIEEVQILANRMEAALEVKGDIKSLYEDLRKLKDARKSLKKEVMELILTRDKLDS